MKSISNSLFWFASAALVAVCQTASAAEAVQFNYHLPQVGQQAEHEVQYDLDLNITLRQGGKTASSQNQQLSRNIQRHVNVLQVAGDRAIKVQVYYDKAQEIVTQAQQSAVPRTLPIEGKSYLVERRGKDLLVTDLDGNPAAEDERPIVAANMDSVGHSNQLGRFLHGKTVSVGETLKLPKEMAADLLGLREANGDAQKVELTLRGVQAEPDRRVADFAALVVVKMGAGSTLEVRGDLEIDVDRCHITAANLSGPISSEGEQAATGDKLEVLTDGTLKATVRSHDLQ